MRKEEVWTTMAWTCVGTYREEYVMPVHYRLAMKDEGPVLQGLFEWTEYGPDGETGGSDWRDMPIVDLRSKKESA